MRRKRHLALLALLGCGTAAGPRLVLHLVLPERPSPSDDGLVSLQIAVVWDGGDSGVTEPFRDGGLDVPLPTGPVDLVVTGLDDGGAPRWRGVARGVALGSDIGNDGGATVATLFFGPIGVFASFGSVAAMPPLTGSAATSWPDGRVVISGGQLADGGLSSGIWVYDPRTVQVSPFGQSLVPRAHHLAVQAVNADGTPVLLLAGGDGQDGGATDAVELFWSGGAAQLQPLSSRQREPSGAATGDGLLVLVGCGFPDSRALDLYLPEAATNADGGYAGSYSLPSGASCGLGQVTWLPSPAAFVIGDGSDGGLFHDIPYQAATWWASTQEVRTRFGAVARGQGVLQFGGLRGGLADGTFEGDPDAGSLPASARLQDARADFGWLQLPNDGGVLVVGGVAFDGSALDSAETFDPENPMPAATSRMAQARIHPAIADISGYGAALVVSGERPDGSPVGGLEIYTY